MVWLLVSHLKSLDISFHICKLWGWYKSNIWLHMIFTWEVCLTHSQGKLSRYACFEKILMCSWGWEPLAWYQMPFLLQHTVVFGVALPLNYKMIFIWIYLAYLPPIIIMVIFVLSSFLCCSFLKHRACLTHLRVLAIPRHMDFVC